MRISISIFILFIAFGLKSYGQNDSTRIIKGFVFTSSDREGMPGCSVWIQNIPNGTMTDMNGKFELAIPREKNVTLVISCISEPVYVKTKIDKDYYRIKFDKQKPTHYLRFSSGIFKNSVNNDFNPHFEIGYGFSFGPGFKIKYISGVNLHYYPYMNSNTNIIGIELPLQIKYNIDFRFYIQGGLNFGYPIFVKSNLGENSERIYFNPVLSLGYKFNPKWSAELGFNYGLTDIGIHDNKISRTEFTVMYRFK